MLTRPRSEDGMVLIITLIFVLIVGLVVSAVMNEALANIKTTTINRSNRALNYDADAAMDVAIATIRPNATQGFLDSCSSISYTGGSATLRVDCYPVVAPAFQRHVQLQVCTSSESATQCNSDALLKADVTFYDDGAYGRAVGINTWSTR